MTYTVVLAEPEGTVLVGVVSGSLAVGNRVPWARACVGAVATQGYTNITLGPLVLSLLERGYNSREAVDLALRTDPEPDKRQLLVFSCRGNGYAHTGVLCPPAKGARIGIGFVCGGNMLSSSDVIDVMYRVLSTTSDLHPIVRLIKALKAGHEAGGDRRGDRSAAVVYVEPYSNPIRVQVDYSLDPLKKLEEKLLHIIT
ncbi:MAG: DUF1028 domain-containing protein [Thermoprotei archaeon]|nr:MAG: DUF1028 domain-containing protein [Thermoprotei archaeon]RLE89614.1 MAG: DUF1028 domain-containing protein [Thermoprotei archaeon]